MGKRIVVCLDGTWNEEGQTDRGVETETNVLKLHNALVRDADQVPIYLEGVGTKLYEKVSGGAFGWGLFNQIKDGYRALSKLFTPGDDIYIFGFSRGAYSARSLAGMILHCGLLRSDVNASQLNVPDDVLNLLTTDQDPGFTIDATDRMFAMYKSASDPRYAGELAAMKHSFCRDTYIRMVGVWDTVGALGVPNALVLPALQRVDNSIKESFFGFLDTMLSPRIAAAYHAVAIDENRKPFVPTLWTENAGSAPRINVPGSNVEQVWFTGAHSNVGGGYADSGLSDIPLLWMIDRAKLQGLRFGAQQLAAIKPDATSLRRDSLKEFLEIGAGQTHKNTLLNAFSNVVGRAIDKLESSFLSVNREISRGSCIHNSVNARLQHASVAEPGGTSRYKPNPRLSIVDSEGVFKVNTELYTSTA